MECPSCEVETIDFAVPPDLREYAPDSAAQIGICPRCLRMWQIEATEPTPDFSRVIDDFPTGDAGIAMAIAAGLLVDSVTLNREAILGLFEHVESAGVDPWLTLERLAATPRVEPATEIDRLRQQLDQLA